jgi:hypothetical protein
VIEMSIDERRRQKQLAKKKQKRKAKLGEMTPVMSIMAGLKKQAEEAARAPIHECLAPQRIFQEGVGTVILARRMGPDEIAVAGFLLDVFCLGAKDAFLRVFTVTEYETTIGRVNQAESLVRVDPSCIRKLVEQGVEYAQNIGFEPHADYQMAKLLFGDIDAGTCPETYEFGYNGKPLFIPGPHTTPKRYREVMRTLEKTCGPGQFDAVPLTRGPQGQGGVPQ